MTIAKIPSAVALALSLLAGLVEADTPVPPPAPAVISVDAGSSPGSVNRLVFGQSVEAADNARIFHSDTTDLNTIETAVGFWDPVKQAPVPVMAQHARQAGLTMLRYPGGSLVCNYDWRKTVGPLETRGNWKFGIDEYLKLCGAIGAEPMFTVSDYVLPADQLPAHVASLVEYLNAPATPDHPWAMKRKDWGHPDPYGVKWFELGNESADGNMRVLPHRQYTAEQYAAYANATAAAMRAVDPTIKIGLVTIPGPGTDVDCSWNKTVVRLAGKSVDFLIVHLYGPKVGKVTPQPEFFQSCMAVGEQDARHLDDYQEMALRESGRALPVAITEYNGPCPDREETRFSYGVALECADLLRIFLQPEHHILAADYWQFNNGAFGMVRSDREDPTGGKIEEKPAFALYSLWAAHLGTRLAAVKVEGPRLPFAGAGSVEPAGGDAYVPSHPFGPISTNGLFKTGKVTSGVTVDNVTDTSFVVNFDAVNGPSYPLFASLRKPSATGAFVYTVTCEARYISKPDSDKSPIALGVSDARGWPATHSASVISGIGANWKSFETVYRALPDTSAIILQGRLPRAKISGKLEVRSFKVEASFAPQFPTYALLTASASLSEDGKVLHLIVFNKSANQEIPAHLHVAGFDIASASIFEVNGPSLDALSGVTQTVKGAPLDVTGPEPQHVFPAHSMTAIDFVVRTGH